MTAKTADRKNIHLDLARRNEALANTPNQLDRVRLTHNALPELDFDAVSTRSRFLGYDLAMPLMIGAMTGGTDRADTLNAHLAEAANAAGVGLAFGSQRASLENGNGGGRGQARLRRLAPSVPLIGNLGGVQLARDGGIDLALRAAESIEADALAIHLNPLQELVQPEGDRDWRGVEEAITTLVEKLPCPVIVKEVGAGLSASVAGRVAAMGVRYVDCAGLGGTNWTRIENLRRDDGTDTGDTETFAPYLDWGIPTLEALKSIRSAQPSLGLIASGGIRNGLDAARAIWLGADMVAAAGHFLKAAEDDQGQPSPEALARALERWQEQCRIALFLTGSADLSAFRSAEGKIE